MLESKAGSSPGVMGTGKIFGIGLSKTGTTSLANALQILGYQTRDNMGVARYAIGDLASVDLEVVGRYDALTDTPIPSFYRELDARYPGSKFILTVRERGGWLTSCKKQFTAPHAARQSDAHRRLFTDLYGTDVFDEERFATGYRRFIEGAHEYFRNRPADLLILDISAGEGWEKLCAFLGQPVPEVPFPKANVTQIRWMRIEDVAAVAQRAGRKLVRGLEPELGQDGLKGRGMRSRMYSARKAFHATVQALRGESAAEMAARQAHKAITAGLTELNPGIPIVSRLGEPIEYAVRKEWNHFWLVDPLDGEAAFASGAREFSVNIALIEDGRPIYGVVHAPAMDTTYYGRAGKESFRRTDANDPILLTRGRAQVEPALADRMPPQQTSWSSYADGVCSQALALCALSEANDRRMTIVQATVEWHTAAAHPIVSSAGMRICEGESGKELCYNKEDLANGPVRVI